MKRIVLVLFCFMTYFLSAQHKNYLADLVAEHPLSSFEKHDIFDLSTNSRKNMPSELQNYSMMNIDAKALEALLHTNANSIELSIPSLERNNLQLQLVEVRFDDLIIKTSDSKKNFKYKAGKHFRGIIKGETSSIVALSFFENDVMGFISSPRSNGNIVIGKMQDNSNDYILYEDNQLMQKLKMQCATPDNGVQYSKEELQFGENNRALTDCVRMFFEVDNNIFVQKGGTTQTVNYVTGLYNQVAALYLAESIKTTVSEIFVWSTTSPYTGTTSSAMLSQFEAQKNGFNGNIAMLLSYGASGGIAYVNTLCNSISDYRMGFSSITSSYLNVPTYSWSIEVVTHEFGHILGSQHTHACAWNGNNTAIDGCYTTEGGCPNPGLPSGGGTVMSYCHLTGAGINFANGFGTQPGNLIRSKVTNATCLTACPGAATPTCTDGIQNGQETGIDCGGPTCPACPTGCTTNSGVLTLVLDNYPGETTWNIKNASGTTLYSGGPYSTPNSTVNVPVCLPNACYTFNIFDSYGDGICCLYGQGSFNLVVAGVNKASGGQFNTSQTISFCLGSSAPTCTDGIKNGQETGIDCGGPTCPACPTCTDGIKNGQETGIDCGGPTCPACPTCTDGIKNGQETGIDCGGPTCPPCTSTATCTDGIKNGQETGIDCGGPTCPACPTCTDGIKNGQETGIDCGGPTCPACPTCTDGIKNGQETGIDCGGPTCPPCTSTATCTDGIKNGQETGVDCGGPACPPCPATCTDGIQNGQETGIDCGGPTCPACPSSGTTTLGAYYFETGWDNWTDGGDDADRYTGSRSFEGTWSISLRDDMGVESSMTSPVYATAPTYLSLKVEFNFYPYSMEPGEDFFLQYSNNNGSTWTNIASWVSGTNFNNNQFYAAIVSINKSTYNFSNTSKFRFFCDASTNSDLIYIDAVKVKGSLTANLEGAELIPLSALSEEKNGIVIYPNPTQDYINIGLPSEVDGSYQVQLMDITGRVLYNQYQNENMKIDVASYNQGMYFVKISNADGELLHSQKVVISNNR